MGKHSGPVKIEHPPWPINPEDHLFTVWRAHTNTTQYRTCVHPQCPYVEYRDNPRVKGE